MAGVLLALFAGRDRPGGAAPLMLAASLPFALASSPSMRRNPAFAPWIVMTISLALGLWSMSSGNVLLSLFFVSATGAALFLLESAKGKAALTLLSALVVLIAYFSSGHGGANPMMQFWKGLGLTEAQAYTATFAFRKTAHFTFYGAVALAALGAVRAVGAERAEAVRAAFLAACAVASFDELRQSGYANRSGSVWDILLDLAGAASFVGLSEWRRAKAR